MKVIKGERRHIGPHLSYIDRGLPFGNRLGVGMGMGGTLAVWMGGVDPKPLWRDSLFYPPYPMATYGNCTTYMATALCCTICMAVFRFHCSWPPPAAGSWGGGWYQLTVAARRPTISMWVASYGVWLVVLSAGRPAT